MLGGVRRGLADDAHERLGNGGAGRQLPRHAHADADQRERAHDRRQLRRPIGGFGLGQVVEDAPGKLRDLVKRLRRRIFRLQEPMENGQPLPDGVVHAGLHAHHRLVAGHLGNARHRLAQLDVLRFQKLVRPLDLRIERLLLSHVHRHHAPAFRLAQAHRIALEQAHPPRGRRQANSLGKNRSPVSARTRLEIGPKACGLGQVGGEPQIGQTRAHRVVHVQDAPLAVCPDDAFGQAVERIDHGKRAHGRRKMPHVEHKRRHRAEQEERRVGDEQVHAPFAQRFDDGRRAQRQQRDFERHGRLAFRDGQHKADRRSRQVDP